LKVRLKWSSEEWAAAGKISWKKSRTRSVAFLKRKPVAAQSVSGDKSVKF